MLVLVLYVLFSSPRVRKIAKSQNQIHLTVRAIVIESSKSEYRNIRLSDIRIFRDFYVIGNKKNPESYYPIFAYQPFSYVIETYKLHALHCTAYYALHVRTAATGVLQKNQPVQYCSKSYLLLSLKLQATLSAESISSVLPIAVNHISC